VRALCRPCARNTEQQCDLALEAWRALTPHHGYSCCRPCYPRPLHCPTLLAAVTWRYLTQLIPPTSRAITICHVCP